MKINVSVREFERRLRQQTIEIVFNGQLDMGEKINMYAEYNDEGKMINCSSAYSSMNSADYYIEIAEVFKMMKDLEGEKIKEIMKKVKQEKEVFRPELNETEEKLQQVNEEFRPIRNKYDELTGKIKRARTEKSIEKYKKGLNDIQPEYSLLLNKRESLCKQIDEILNKMEKVTRLQIA